MPLSAEEREQFLAEPHVAALSVASGADRAPLTVPIWYQYTPGGEAWVLTGTTARKTRLIAEASRFTLMVQRMTPSIRYVSVEGPVTRTVPMTDELLWELSARYLPESQVPSYVEMAKRDHGPQLVIYLQPRRWLSADLGTL
jgi:nitroimidazol reductase NimA-like FMN-containing flavoprotein (pyridoxamine 5'-phosphate oxidase superfamily)